MPTELTATAASTGNMGNLFPWLIAIILGVICIYLVMKIAKLQKPKSTLEDYEAVKELNIREGRRFEGRWVLVFSLGIDGHIISTERVERFEGMLYSSNGRKLYEVKPNSIWNFGGVPATFCWSDRYRNCDPIVDEAVVKNIMRINNNRESVIDKLKNTIAALKNPETKQELKDNVMANLNENPATIDYPIDGWKQLAAEFEKEHPEIEAEKVGAPWHVVDFEAMRVTVPSTQPSLFFNVLDRLQNAPTKKSSLGILDWIKKNPIIFGGILIAIVAAFLILPNIMK